MKIWLKWGFILGIVGFISGIIGLVVLYQCQCIGYYCFECLNSATISMFLLPSVLLIPENWLFGLSPLIGSCIFLIMQFIVLFIVGSIIGLLISKNKK